MKFFISFLISISAHAMASDFGGTEKCGPLKFKYNDLVRVIDPSSFYEECEGHVSARSADCSYYVIQLCDDVASHFDPSQLKLIKKRTCKK